MDGSSPRRLIRKALLSYTNKSTFFEDQHESTLDIELFRINNKVMFVAL